MLSGTRLLQGEKTKYPFSPVPWAGPERKPEGKENQSAVSYLITEQKPFSLFLDLTIALSNPIKFFSLQEKRSVKLKDGSVEVSLAKFCHCL